MNVPDDLVALNSASTPAAVEQDTPCRRCAYNLRGLAMLSRCPECGTPVGLSVRGDLLRYSDPRYLATLHKGVRLLLWAILVNVVGIIALVVANASRRSAGLAPGTGLMPLARLIPLAGSVVTVIGAWLLTTPDPSGIGEDRYGTVRKLIRYSLAAAIVDDIITFHSQMALPPTAYLVLQVIGGLSKVAGLVGTFAQLQYLEKLATRLPNDALSDRSRLIKCGLGISYGVIVIYGLISTALIRRTRLASPGAIGVVYFAGLALLAAMVFGIMYVFLLIKFGRSLAEQTVVSRLNWSSKGTSGPA